MPPSLAKEAVPLALQQQYQRLSGQLLLGGKPLEVDEGRMKGERIGFKLGIGGRTYAFSGAVKGDSMGGTVDGAPARAAWSAQLRR